MAGNLQIVFPESMYAYTAAASSADPAYPAINVKDAGRVKHTWRALTNTGEWIRADLGSAQTIAGISVVNTNGAILTVETSTNAIAWTTQIIVVLNNYNEWTDRLNATVVFGSPVTARYVRVQVAATTSPLYAEVAGLVVFSAVSTLDQNMGKLAVDPQPAKTELGYLGGGGEGNSEGVPMARIRLGKDYWLRSPLSSNVLRLMQRLSRLDGGQSVILFENNNDPTATYYGRVVEKSTFTIQGSRHVGYDVLFEERT